MNAVGRILKRLLLILITAVVGFVFGVLTLYIHHVRSGPDLKPWHETELTEEFSAARSGSIRGLDDYRELEERLFRQLEKQVYRKTGTGPAFRFARYSRGSLSDPDQREGQWNRSFELPSSARRGGVLLLHGMSDGPYSLLALGKALHEAGYWVVGLRIPGHGTAPAGLKTVTWADMAAAVQLAMRHLEARLGKVPIHMIGYSNGAALAVDYALKVIEGSAAPAAQSLILISPAIAVSPAAALAQWQARVANLPGLGKMAWTAILPEFDPYKYNSFAVNAGQLVYRLTSSLKARIEARAASGPLADFPPVLVFLSTVDATVSADAVVDNLLEHLSPGPSELVLFDLNRSVAVSSLVVSDPGPLTRRMLADEALPFALTLVTNENSESVAVISRHKPALSGVVTDTPLGLSWPPGVLSLSHVALPFSPEDPLYGETRPASRDTLYLGRLPIQAERGLLLFSADWLLRIRHNPFYAFLEQRTLDWLEAGPALEASDPQLQRAEDGP